MATTQASHGAHTSLRSLALVAACCLAATVACSSVVPEDIEFAAARCETVIDDGIEGLAVFELGAILEVTTPEGQEDEYAAGYLRAMRLAVQEINQRDIAGHRLRIRVCDTHADWAVGGGQISRDMATWLIDKGGVQAIVSDASADTFAIQSVAVDRGRLLMAISATSEELTWLADDGLVWRVAPSDLYQGVVLARMASQTVAAGETMALLAVKTPYGDGLNAAISKALGKGLTVHTFAADGGGVEDAVAGAAADKPGALIVVADVATTARIVNLRASHPELASISLLLADGACDATLTQQPLDPDASLVGTRCVRPGQAPNATYHSFAERYNKAYSLNLADAAYAQHAFDTVYCLAMAHAWALGSGGSGAVDGKSLAEGLRHLSSGKSHPFMPNEITAMIGTLLQGTDIDVDGTSGPLDFNPNTGEAPSGYEAQKVDAKGELVPLGWYEVDDHGDGTHTVTWTPKSP